MATPKHVAKSVTSYAHHHPNVEFSAFVIPQIPGSIKRSTPIHGVIDSVLKAKKYEIPLLVFHPFVGGGIAVAYVVSGRFNPAQNAMMFSPDGALEEPLTKQQRKEYARGLEELLRSDPNRTTTKHDSGSTAKGKSAPWRELQANASFATDADGHPALSFASSGSIAVDPSSTAGVSYAPAPFIGLTRDNILSSTASPAIARDLLVIRLRQELSKGTSPHTTERQFREDLELLEKLLSAGNQTVAATASVMGTER